MSIEQMRTDWPALPIGNIFKLINHENMIAFMGMLQKD